jgi:plasmid stabilization system protein ParE
LVLRNRVESNAVHGLYKAIEKAANNKHLWREVEHPDVKDIFFLRYERHDVFFRDLSKDVLGVINVLHESMNIPNRLKEDLDE